VLQAAFEGDRASLQRMGMEKTKSTFIPLLGLQTVPIGIKPIVKANGDLVVALHVPLGRGGISHMRLRSVP
jgi:uncharacterized membrane protein YqgA involved in biofilm formation